MNDYIEPSWSENKFCCPYCNTIAQQNWNARGAINSDLERNDYPQGLDGAAAQRADSGLTTSTCTYCKKEAVWVGTHLVYPLTSSAPSPVDDMPEDVKGFFIEARKIVKLSPRAAVALLRLSVETLVNHLDAKGKTLNDRIGYLVAQGLPEKIQKALDTIRVIGNEAVHPGQIDLNDDTETASQLFKLVNFIVKNRITEPGEVDSLYESIVPDNKKKAINKRDTTQNQLHNK